MHLSSVSILGLLAEACIIVAQVPQIYKSYKTKSTDDISLVMLWTVLIGLLLWVVYGIVKPDYVIIIANVVSAVMFAFVMYAKLKFSKK